MSVIEVRNKVQGTSAEYENTTYGTPPVSTGMILVKRMVKTNIIARGWAIAHRIPRMDCW